MGPGRRQLPLLVIANVIWHADGATALRAFRNALREPMLTDDQIIDRLRAISPDAARALRTWPT